MQRSFLIIFACLVLSLVAGCGGDSSSTTGSGDATTEVETQGEGTSASEKAGEDEEGPPDIPKVSVPKGPPPKKLVIEEMKKGSGATAKSGDKISVEYIGVVYKTGELFDATWENGEPFTFKLGGGEVIKGWDQGLKGMKVGGERKLIIPPNLAYGPEAIFPSIPAYSTLVFQTKLVAVK